MLNNVVGGSSITQVHDSIYLINVVGARRARRARGARDLPEPAARRPQRPAGAAARHRRHRITSSSSRSSGGATASPPSRCRRASSGDLQPADRRRASCSPPSTKFAAALPAGYTIAVGGTVEESGKGERPIADVVPLMLFLMATVLMLQLQSFQKLFLVVSVAPLGLIGVVAALLLDRPAAGLRRDPGRAGADRHHHPQLGDPGDPDRRLPRPRAWRRGTPWSRPRSTACGRSCSPRPPPASA